MSEDYATGKVNFYLQYFFPPSSVGETGRTGGMPGRREVGHGMLAQRALAPIVPDEVSLLLDAMPSEGQGCFCRTTLFYAKQKVYSCVLFFCVNVRTRFY